MEEETHIRALRRLLRNGLADYKRITGDPAARVAVDHYRQLLRKDAATISRHSTRKPNQQHAA